MLPYILIYMTYTLQYLLILLVSRFLFDCSASSNLNAIVTSDLCALNKNHDFVSYYPFTFPFLLDSTWLSSSVIVSGWKNAVNRGTTLVLIKHLRQQY